MSEIKVVPIEKIKMGLFRVRTKFDKEKMKSLILSIKRSGLLYPIIVKSLQVGDYELIAGERRFRAAKEAGLKDIPVQVRRNSCIENGLIEMGLENIMREDLSFYERGRWVAKMLDDYGFIVTTLSEETGIPQQSLSNWLNFYEESERIKSSPMVGEKVDPEKLPLSTLLETKRAPIPDEKKIELIGEYNKMAEPPSVAEIRKAVRLIEQNPELKSRKALELAQSVTLLLPIPIELWLRLKQYAGDLQLPLQDAVIKILRDRFE